MDESLDLDHLGSPPLPPPKLYKYLSPERVENVLEARTFRFSFLMSTNDPFEVRATFRKLIGPKFASLLESQLTDTFIDESIDQLIHEELDDNHPKGYDHAAIRVAMATQYGQDLIQTLRCGILDLAGSLFPHLNATFGPEAIFEKLGRDFLCFSLSERFDSSPMWAHYAQNNTGFVLSLDASHSCFKNGSGNRRTRLQKVEYIDGLLEEPLQNPQAAFISKTTDWQYEREWRLYSKLADISKTVMTPFEDIHLVDFPSDLVTEILIGYRADDVTVDRILTVAKRDFPHASIFRAIPDKMAHTYSLKRV